MTRRRTVAAVVACVLAATCAVACDRTVDLTDDLDAAIRGESPAGDAPFDGVVLDGPDGDAVHDSGFPDGGSFPDGEPAADGSVPNDSVLDGP